jgi:glycolate oxidase iron-sulfur subunit
MTPAARSKFSAQLIERVERPSGRIMHRVGMLTGCVQDIVFSDINRDTVDVLLANGCEVHTPPVQYCCGSLHAHNGEVEVARDLARRQMDAFDVDALDAIITNAAGCGSHLKSYGILLADDSRYRGRASAWSAKVRDIHEWLCQIGFRKPQTDSERSDFRNFRHLSRGMSSVPRAEDRKTQPPEVLKPFRPRADRVAESTWLR